MALYRESFIFRMETDEPAMFWTGHGDLLLPADLILPEPTLALGGGDLVNLPDLEQLINGTAQRVEVVLSGVSQRTILFAQEEGPQVAGAAVYIGRIQFDDEWQQLGPVVWEWTGEGRIVNAEAGATIVRAFEATLDAVSLASAQDDLARTPAKLSAVWKPLLASGPAP